MGERKKPAAAKPAPRPLQELAVGDVKNVGLQAAAVLRARGVETAGALLGRTPKRYVDLRNADDWGLVRERVVGSTVALEGIVADSKPIGPIARRGLSLLLREPGGIGSLRVVFFRAPPGLSARAPLGARIRAVGSLREGHGDVELHQPKLIASDAKLVAIEPVYRSIGSLSSAMIARIVAGALEDAESWDDPVPEAISKRLALRPSAQALRLIHRPGAKTDVETLIALQRGRSWAHQRLGFEELLTSAVALELAKRRGGKATVVSYDPQAASVVGRRLGLTLTSGQTGAIDTLLKAMTIDLPMRRLLVGDVGSGKTAVAAAVTLAVARAGGSVAWLCPTTLVAEQHANTLAKALSADAGPIAVLLGSTTKRARLAACKAIASGAVRAVVGTHAILEESAIPPSLTLAVIDEQHRFGVGQRLALVQNRAPHMLVISATPIPRTLALARYGDLDMVTMPTVAGQRQPVTTKVVAPGDRAFVLHTIDRALAAGEGKGRAFVVVPRIESDEAERSNIGNVEPWLAEHFGVERVGVLHGGMSADAQREALHEFRSGRTRVLLATSIVEVGLDVPEANVIAILGAEQFGVAQLHQLRGRVGRAGQKAACLLVADVAEEESQARLEDIAQISDGFALAERDLTRRGAGEWFGERQTGGDAMMNFADPMRDLALVTEAVECARALVDEDPTLEKYPALARSVARVLAHAQGPTAEDAG